MFHRPVVGGVEIFGVDSCAEIAINAHSLLLVVLVVHFMHVLVLS